MHEAIKGKEIIRVGDIMAAFDCSKQVAYKIIRNIKKTSNTVETNGKCHIKDYCKHYKLNLKDYR